MERYIHPKDEKIKRFIDELCLQGKNLKETIDIIFEWFNKHIEYSRLNEPYCPLQRSDLDVLQMLSGTCGDYSNLLVSVLMALNFQVQYAYVKVDCYNNPQDHICVVVWHEDEWKLIDATLPYRKWYGFDCPHKEYELLSVEWFWERMKGEEKYWTEKAKEFGSEKYAGLLYAPWIHQDVCIDTRETLETVFYLLVFENRDSYQIYVNYLVYSKEKAFSPTMCHIKEGKVSYYFSEKEQKHIWDNEQWSQEYLEDMVPEKYRTRYYENLVKSMRTCLPRIEEIVSSI